MKIISKPAACFDPLGGHLQADILNILGSVSNINLKVTPRGLKYAAG
jgi:hypothetical protein